MLPEVGPEYFVGGIYYCKAININFGLRPEVIRIFIGGRGSLGPPGSSTTCSSGSGIDVGLGWV